MRPELPRRGSAEISVKLGGRAIGNDLVIPALGAPDGLQGTTTAPTTRRLRREGNFPIRGTTDRIKIGGARTAEDEDGRITVCALAPGYVALTTRTQPVLFWYLSRSSNKEGRPVEFAITREGDIDPLLELTLDGTTGGVRAIDLAQHGVQLEPGASYEWVVAVVRDPDRRSRDVVAAARVHVVGASPALAAALAAAQSDHARRARAYARGESDNAEFAGHGIWYDALAEAALARAADPKSADATVLWDSLVAAVTDAAAPADQSPVPPAATPPPASPQARPEPARPRRSSAN